jgi:hypothetical protein
VGVAASAEPWGPAHRHRELVAGGRYELDSNYALKIQAVAASVTAPV